MACAGGGGGGGGGGRKAIGSRKLGAFLGLKGRGKALAALKKPVKK